MIQVGVNAYCNLAAVQARIMPPGQYMEADAAHMARQGILAAFEEINAVLRGAGYVLPVKNRNVSKDLRLLNVNGAVAHMLGTDEADHAWKNALQALALADLPLKKETKQRGAKKRAAKKAAAAETPAKLEPAPENVEAMRIDSNGNIGIGTPPPSKTLEVQAATGQLTDFRFAVEPGQD